MADSVHKPFGELSDAEKGKLLLAAHRGERIEAYGCGEWYTARPAWGKSVPYRIAPEPKTPDTINWEHVAPEYNFMARDADGDVFAYRVAPEMCGRQWKYGKNDRIGEARRIDTLFASYRRGTVDWKDSLVIRPGYEAAA